MPGPIPILVQNQLQALGARLATARKAREMTQGELARLAGLGLSTVVSLEAGHAGVSVGNLLKAIDALGLLGSVQDWLRPGQDPELLAFAQRRLDGGRGP